MANKRLNFLILTSVLLVAFVLRIFQLSKVPLYGDELTELYDSYSVLKTGMDQTGQKFPITFRMGAGRPAGYVYGSIPFVAVFGLSVWGVRGLSLVSGLGLVIVMYFLGRKLFSENVGLTASFLTAISPWELSLSRGGFEAHFALFLALAGIAFFIYAKDKPWLYIIAALFWGLTIHTYPTYKLTLPIVILLLIWFCGGLKQIVVKSVRKYIILSALVLTFFATLSVQQTIFGSSEERFSNINIFSQSDLREKIVQKINYERSINQIRPNLASLFHNKVVEYSSALRDAYLNNFSIDFLFLKGDGNPRHNMSESGELYLIDLPLIFLGICLLIRKKQNKLIVLIILWILAVPIATSLLIDPHALRNSFMFPPLVLLSAAGLVFLWGTGKGFRKLGLVSIVLIIWFIQFIFILERLYFVSPNKFANFWSYPAKEAVEIVINNRDKYDYLFLSNRVDNAEYAYLVYKNIDPLVAIEQNEHSTFLGELSFKKFDNVYIGTFPLQNISNFIRSLGDKKILLVGNIVEAKYLENYSVVDSLDKTYALFVKDYNSGEKR